MKSAVKIKGALASFIAAASLVGPSSAEMRSWTNLKGQKITAELIAVDGERVRLRMEGGRDVTIERDTLSVGDQQYLKEYGGAEELKIDPKAKVGMPAKTVKIDPKSIKKRDDLFLFPEDFSLEFDITESEHFLVMTSGRARGKDIAELAERLYHGMTFQHPGFVDKFGDEKMAIFLCGEETDHKILGQYYVNLLSESGNGEAASNTAATWAQASGSGLRLDSELCEKYNVRPAARAFNATDKRTFKTGVWNPFPTHCLAGNMLGVMMGSAGGGIGSDGYFAISTGHSYFKEIQLCGETVTTMLNADLYESDEIIKAGGFDDGRKWARSLRDLVKKEKVTPKLSELWRLRNAGDLSPELTVLCYGFAQYMQSTPDRLANFSKLMDRVDTSRQIPAIEEAAKMFGFESVAEFEADWIAYMKSTAFK